jgi:hypothetical protein
MDSLLLLAPLLGAAWCTVIQMRVRRLERRVQLAMEVQDENAKLLEEWNESHERRLALLEAPTFVDKNGMTRRACE